MTILMLASENQTLIKSLMDVAFKLLEYAFILGLSMIIPAFFMLCYWKIFKKAHIPGWHAIIPYYSTYQLYKITTGNGWLCLVNLIPLGAVINFYISYRLGYVFGKDVGFCLGLVFLPAIFLPMLAFSDVDYYGSDV